MGLFNWLLSFFWSSEDKHQSGKTDSTADSPCVKVEGKQKTDVEDGINWCGKEEQQKAINDDETLVESLRDPTTDANKNLEHQDTQSQLGLAQYYPEKITPNTVLLKSSGSHNNYFSIACLLKWLLSFFWRSEEKNQSDSTADSPCVKVEGKQQTVIEDGINWCGKEEQQKAINDDETPVEPLKDPTTDANKNLDGPIEHHDILSQLGLTQYYPEKITLHTVLLKSSGSLNTLHDVPWYFLSKILMLDYRVREDLLPKPESNGEKAETMDSGDVLDDVFAQLTDGSVQKSCSVGPHPMDVLIAIFWCTSNLLRQIICEKLFICKLSLPLVLPPVLNSQPKLLLWSLRSIVLQMKTENNEFYEKSLVNHPTKVVACIRIGGTSKSKSKFLNELLDGPSHDTFFHRDSKNGMREKIISKGLIEFAMSLPGGSADNAKDQLKNTMTLMNMRGNAIVHRLEAQFLQKISDIMLVMVDVAELEKADVISFLKSLASATELILIISKRPVIKLDAKCKETVKRCINEISLSTENISFHFTGSGEKNIKHLCAEIRAKINKFFLKAPTANILEKSKALAEELGMDVDENTTKCANSQKLSQELIALIKNNNSDIMKGEILPLQSLVWNEWTKFIKEKHRLPKVSQGKISKPLRQRKAEIQNKQLKCLENNSTFITYFTDLLNKHEDQRHYIMKWLKFYLDDVSRKKIPALQKTYCLKWEEICQIKDVQETKGKQELKELENKIAEASFGIEHILREIGQVYETCSILTDEGMNIPDIIQEYNKLPRLMAELLLSGNPIELMDGDAAHVPLRWVRAVLGELQNVVGDSRVFVLSVVGAQSSGKSTLLNAMFGLQLPVAAGRCTRGVYAQLVPVCEELKEKYEYILVVDTEGLKAPELSNEKYNHDNEIATFVTGLGDVSLVNIKGENVSEMQDIFQTVIHALVKMCLVNKSLKLQPTCIFLHQNVSGVDAGHKMRRGQQMFLDMLNKVTRATGELENSPHISKLSQIADFDVSRHIWYFSDLWEGDPPMAPVNPGYSEGVQKLKSYLLKQVMQERTQCLTLSKLGMRIEDLWTGILQEDFVFSLRNSLESRAYIALENKVTEIIADIRTAGLNWVNNKTQEIHSQEMELDNFEESILKDLEDYLKKEVDEKKRNLGVYIDLNEDTEMLEQWRQRTMSKMNSSYEEILTESKNSLQKIIKSVKNHESSKEVKSNCNIL